MGTNEPLLKLNDLLTDYIEVHNEVFSFSFRKIIPIPGLFKTVDHASLAARLTSIKTVLAELSANMQEDTLSGKYASALFKAANQLHLICTKLAAKAGGVAYGYADYNQDVSEYNSLRDDMAKHGEKLNNSIRRQ